jgi:hypothetical protein
MIVSAGSAQTLAGSRSGVEFIASALSRDVAWTKQYIPEPTYYNGSPLIVVYIRGEKFSDTAAKGYFGVSVGSINSQLDTKDIVVIRNEEKSFLLIAVKDGNALNSSLSNSEVASGISWINERVVGFLCPMKATGKFSTKFDVFTYTRDGDRRWSDTDIINLLSTAFKWYSNFFGYKPVDSITVTDTNVDFAANPSAANESACMRYTGAGSRKTVVSITFKSGYGLTSREQDTAKHAFAHELLHSWFYPVKSADADYAEALTQYLTQVFLLENGFITQASFDDRIQNYIHGNYSGAPNKMILLIHNFYQTDKAACVEFMKKATKTLAKGGSYTTDLFKDAFGEEGTSK